MLSNRQEIQWAFSKCADTYDEHAQLQLHVLKQCIQMVARRFAEQAKVLDVGCGTGRAYELMKGRWLDWQMTGIDYAFGMCQHARKRNIPQLVNADAQDLPFANASFDGVLSSLAMQWVADPKAMLSEMGRVLRPGGQMVVATFGTSTLHELKEAFAAQDAHQRINEFLSTQQVAQLAKEAGLRVRSVTTQILTQHYEDVFSLIHSLKKIGAARQTGNAQRKQGLTTPSMLRAVDATYRAEYPSQDGRIPSTWEVIFLMAEVP